MEKNTDPRVKHMPRSWSNRGNQMWAEGSRGAADAVWGRLTAGLAELCRKPRTKAGRRRTNETDNKAIADCL